MSIIKKTATVAFVALIATVTVPANPAAADSTRDQQWHLKSLKLAQVRSLSTGAGIVVAVIDSGVSAHRDLRNNLLNGKDITSPENPNGRKDKDGHGTGMASLIAAHGRGQNGVRGIAPRAKILPIRIGGVNDSESINPSSPFTQAIKWAVANKARVINVSMATGPEPGLISAVADAVEQNVVIVAGIGNTSTNSLAAYPAAADGALAVGATGRDGKHSSISFKSPKVQLCAPGVDIESAGLDNAYRRGTGTSDSTAIVSGAAALVRAKFPELSAKEVVHRLTATADDIGPPGRDDECGFGRLNIVRALTEDVPPLEGDTAATASVGPNSTPTAAATIPPTGGASQNAALPDTEPASGSGSVSTILGVLFGVVLAGGLSAFFLIRRRRTS